jgi:hypothetical protein
MKTKKILVNLIGFFMITSCQKSYTCKDKNGNTIGEVEATSLKDANSKCPASSSAE